MAKNTRKHSEAVRKKVLTAAVICAVLLILAAIIGTGLLRSAQKEQRKREEKAGVFEPYQPYGLVYDKKEDRLYFNGEQVRYFEDITDTDRYIKWPNKAGAVDVYAERDTLGALIGVSSFSQQEYADRTPSLKEAAGELEISISIDGYIDDVEEMVKERIEDAYEVYGQYGLTYDADSDRLYYHGELVGYFEDTSLKHYFGPFEDSMVKIYAVRDKQGNLTGLDIDEGTK